MREIKSVVDFIRAVRDGCMNKVEGEYKLWDGRVVKASMNNASSEMPIAVFPQGIHIGSASFEAFVIMLVEGISISIEVGMNENAYRLDWSIDDGSEE